MSYKVFDVRLKSTFLKSLLQNLIFLVCVCVQVIPSAGAVAQPKLTIEVMIYLF